MPFRCDNGGHRRRERHRQRNSYPPERVRQLLGFSIHPPFMGHFGGLHPIRMVDPQAPKAR